jgi:MFS family permease
MASARAADNMKRWVGTSRPATDKLAKGGSVPPSRAINRTQGLVLGFFVIAWIALLVMLAASADVRDVTVRRVPGAGAPAVVAFVLALLAFLTVLAIGVVQGWRWIFWLILLAFAAGVIRVPVAVLQLSGRMVPEGPDWYVVVQGVIGVVQVAVAVAMFAGYRRSGPWGSF